MATPQQSNKRRKWTAPSIASEARRLGTDEVDWNLAGVASMPRTRTRGNQKKEELVLGSVICAPCTTPASVDDNSTAVSGLTDSSVSPKSPSKKPPYSRVIVEVDPMVNMLEQHLRKCPKCKKGKLVLSFPTVCIASSVRIDCSDKANCTYAIVSAAARAEHVVADDSASRHRNTDHALNTLFVLSFIASGDGGTEAARLCGLIGLPNSTTMQSRSFGNIEEQMSSAIQDLTDTIIMRNLEAEVKHVLGDQLDNHGNLLYDLWLQRELPRPLWPVIDGTADMGWQQK